MLPRRRACSTRRSTPITRRRGRRFPARLLASRIKHSIFTLTSGTLNVSYLIDVFGGERRQLESVEAQAEYQHYQLEAAYLTISSNVVAAAIQEASLRAQIAATQEIIADQQQQLNLLQKAIRARRGGALGCAGAAGDAQRDASDLARSAKAARAAAQSADGARRPLSEPRDQPDFRSRQPATARGSAAEPAVEAGRATSRHPVGASAASCRERGGRRRHREHVAAIHDQRQLYGNSVLDFANFLSGARHLEPRRWRDHSDLPRRHACSIKSVRPRLRSMFPRRNIAAR